MAGDADCYSSDDGDGAETHAATAVPSDDEERSSGGVSSHFIFIPDPKGG